MLNKSVYHSKRLILSWPPRYLLQIIDATFRAPCYLVSNSLFHATGPLTHFHRATWHTNIVILFVSFWVNTLNVSEPSLTEPLAWLFVSALALYLCLWLRVNVVEFRLTWPFRKNDITSVFRVLPWQSSPAFSSVQIISYSFRRQCFHTRLSV